MTPVERKSLTAVERKRRLEDRFGTQAAFCRAFGLNPATVSGVLSGIVRNRKVQEIIARELQLTLEEVFPPRELAA